MNFTNHLRGVKYIKFTDYLRLNESESESDSDVRDVIQIADIRKEDLKPKDKYQLQ